MLIVAWLEFIGINAEVTSWVFSFFNTSGKLEVLMQHLLLTKCCCMLCLVGAQRKNIQSRLYKLTVSLLCLHAVKVKLLFVNAAFCLAVPERYD